jgi:hypothetical protein
MEEYESVGDENIFYSYHYEETQVEGVKHFEVCGCDLHRTEFGICLTRSEKVAKHLVEHFDNLAIDEERDMFEELIS